MNLKVMAHKSRTQRLGPSSMPREVEIYTGSEKDCRQVIADLRAAHKEIAENFKWSEYEPVEVHGYTISIYDRYYLVVVE